MPDSYISLYRSRQNGVVLLVVLIFILVTTFAASAMVQNYQTDTRREKEEQLLFVGSQYMRAISAYYNSYPPGSNRALPPSLDALLEDNRFPTPVNHLRRLYPDPMTGRTDWALVTANGGIVGLHSSSLESPLKQSGFEQRFQFFENSVSYAQWAFGIKQ